MTAELNNAVTDIKSNFTAAVSVFPAKVVLPSKNNLLPLA